MQVGIVSPIVVQHPGVASAWETGAGIVELAQIAVVADRLGFHHLTCSEHVLAPAAIAPERGVTYWDPLATFGFVAAHTARIRLVTQVLVLGYHHPLAIAKRYGTLDRVSGGRLTLGVGVGSLEEEFAVLGVPFTDRAARADEALQALRASLGQREPRFHGTYYDYADVVVEPHALQQHLPLWVGGRTMRSLRRAVTYGDGWVPFGLGAEQLSQLLAQVALPDGFEVVLNPGRPVDPIGERARTLRSLTRMIGAGATILGVSVRADSAEHYCAQLQELAGVVKEVENG